MRIFLPSVAFSISGRMKLDEPGATIYWMTHGNDGKRCLYPVNRASHGTEKIWVDGGKGSKGCGGGMVKFPTLNAGTVEFEGP